MTLKWNASMPREKAKEGGANVVLAFRKSSGARAELEAKISAEDAEVLMRTAIEMMKKYKEQA